MSGSAGGVQLSVKPVYHNAPAHQCSHATVGPGRHVVGFENEDYCITGFYFGHGPGGRRTLCYVLRSVDRLGEGLYPLEIQR